MTIPLERCLCCWSTTNWVLQQQMANQQQDQRPQEERIMQLRAQLQTQLQSPSTTPPQSTHYQQVALSPSETSAHSAQSNIAASTNFAATNTINNTNTTDIPAVTTIGPIRQDKKKKKSKRVRTTFTPEQLGRLESEFVSQNYLVGEYRNYLARLLNLNECQVKVWFQNRRIKKRKLEKQEEKEHQ